MSQTESSSPTRTVSLGIDGMHCASCATAVQNALSKVEGVAEARVNFATERASVHLSGNRDLTARLVEAVQKAGFDVREEATPSKPETTIGERREAEARAWFRRWVVGAVLTLPVAIIEMPMHLGYHGWAFPGHGIVSFVLTTGVMAWTGWPFFVRTVEGLRSRRIHMDALVSLGSSAAYITSTVLLARELLGGPAEMLYFESAAMIITLIALGRWLEAHAKRRAGAAIESLAKLVDPTARVERDGGIVEVDVEDLRPGDVVRVRPGERIPADGKVLEGESAVDESLLTGESAPVSRREGDVVTGGSKNTDGALRIEIERVGSDATLGRIIDFVEKTQESKARLQRLADKVASVFIPIVIVIAVIALVGWLMAGVAASTAIMAAVAVLIIACPCALGLATPTAIMAGTGRGARQGLLIRDAESIERVRELDAIIFDKTGTLTEGRPRLVDTHAPEAGSPAPLAIAASLEHHSEHPLARAFQEAAEAEGIEPLKVEEFRSVPGFGVEGRIDGTAYLLGSAELLEREGVDPGDAMRSTADEWRTKGRTVSFLATRDTGVVAAFALEDTIKKSAAGTIRRLEDEWGLQVWLLTGDNAATARAVAGELGIHEDRVLAGVEPEKKAEKVEDLRARGLQVAMVGDGVNDAPALAAADLGIAVGGGAQAAMDAGDLVVSAGDPSGVLRALDLSRAIRRKIIQNLFWAFCYNTILIPVAAFGLLAPSFAAAAMALSSVSVIGNSLLLGRGGVPPGEEG